MIDYKPFLIKKVQQDISNWAKAARSKYSQNFAKIKSKICFLCQKKNGPNHYGFDSLTIPILSTWQTNLFSLLSVLTLTSREKISGT